jgi:hypothetical protein
MPLTNSTELSLSVWTLQTARLNPSNCKPHRSTRVPTINFQKVYYISCDPFESNCSEQICSEYFLALWTHCAVNHQTKGHIRWYLQRRLELSVAGGLRGARCWWRSCLRHCATRQKVSGSIPDGVIGVFHWYNTPGRTMALGLTQPLTEMNTKNEEAMTCVGSQRHRKKSVIHRNESHRLKMQRDVVTF